MHASSEETLPMSCMSVIEPMSALLWLQRISKGRDVAVICDGSVGEGLLVAM